MGVRYLVALLLLALPTQAQECRRRRFDEDSVVCVCDSTHCDIPGPAPTPAPAHYIVITSSRDGLRFHTTSHKFTTTSPSDGVVLEVATASPQQTMLGFGSSFTDAATIMVHSLSPQTQHQLMRSYFGPDGIEYDLVRVPIAGTDFSIRPYSYLDDHHDLQHFSLSSEDTQYKLPLLLEAQQLSQRHIRVVASPWSPPAFMKTNRKLNESGELLPEMWQLWADYLVKFVKEYEDAGVRVWGLTTQNHAFSQEKIRWNSCLWTPETMRDWIVTSLGPTLRGAGLGRVKIMVGDDNRQHLLNIRNVLLSDANASEYISGVAVHWYDDITPMPLSLYNWLEDLVIGSDHHHDHHNTLATTHLLYPHKFLLYTEACIVPGLHGVRAVALGSWLRAEYYATNIIETVSHQVSGWIDWNLALDMTGGPNWADNTVDSPIIINQEQDEFYKQPMFYALGHFSKFVPGGSVRVPAWVLGGGEDLHTTAFIHPHGHLVILLLNTGEKTVVVNYKTECGGYVSVSLPARAIQTVLVAREERQDHARTKYTEADQCGQDQC